MNRENLMFLLGGLAFGVLFGYGLFHALDNTTEAQLARLGGAANVPAPAGPMAPTQQQPSGDAAPMVAEINELKRAIQEDPKDLAALTRLANLYHDVGMWEQASVLYEKALEVAPTNPDLLTDLGICYQELEQFDLALEQFRKAQVSDPGHWQSLYNTVVVAGFNLRRFDEAEEALRKLEKEHPDLPRLDQLRGALEAARQGGRS